MPSTPDAYSTPAPVELWVVDLTSVRPEPAVASDDERERASGLLDESLRRRYLARVTARRAILAGYVGIPPAELEIDRRCTRCGNPTHGRPRLAGVTPAPRFSCSSSGDICLLAVSPRAGVGVDVERIRDDLDVAALALAGIAPPSTGDAEADRVAAYRAWVAHEAVLKGVGAGIAGERTASDEQALREWHRVELDPAPGYAGCVAGPQPIELTVLNWDGGLRRARSDVAT